MLVYMFVNSHAFSLKRHKHGRHWNRELIVTDILSLDSSNFKTAECDFLYFFFFGAGESSHQTSRGSPWVVSDGLREAPSSVTLPQ